MDEADFVVLCICSSIIYAGHLASNSSSLASIDESIDDAKYIINNIRLKSNLQEKPPV